MTTLPMRLLSDYMLVVLTPVVKVGFSKKAFERTKSKTSPQRKRSTVIGERQTLSSLKINASRMSN